MSEELYPYYERELLFIRQMAQQFARKYPAVAGRLLLEPHRSADPHVERLIESFALIAGRIHHKLDDEFPELTDALFSVLYPHYLAPIPSMTILQFDVDAARSPMPHGFVIPRGSKLATQRIDGIACKFRTCYPATLWPIALTQARLETPPFPADFNPPPQTVAALRLRFECQAGQTFSQLSLSSLRLFLNGTDFVVSSLYELLLNNSLQVVIRSGGDVAAFVPVVLSAQECLSPVGFGREEGLFPYSNRSFLGYRLLTELFTFHQKFCFIDLGGWQRACQKGLQRTAEVIVYLNQSQRQLEHSVTASNFRLGCAPAVNLFPQTAEPVRITHKRYEYRIVPDVAYPQGLEVYSIDSVSSSDPAARITKEYQPFYSFHNADGPNEPQTFWYASRRASSVPGDRGTDIYLTLVDLGFDPNRPTESTLVVRTTCTNRDLPARLQSLGQPAIFQLEGAAPLARIVCLIPPTRSLRFPLRRAAYWRLLSHLNLNHFSLSDSEEGRKALREILRLYSLFEEDGGTSLVTETSTRMIDGITRISSRRVTGRFGPNRGESISRGLEVTMEFDEENFRGVGVFLFASVLERFLALYTSLNSFTQLVMQTKQSGRIFKKWPPRAGEHQLL